MARPYSAVQFLGYPVPDCCSNSDDADRFFGDDIPCMSDDELAAELQLLQHVCHMGEISHVTRPPRVNAPDGNPKSFYVWARDRMRRIKHAIDSRRA